MDSGQNFSATNGPMMPPVQGAGVTSGGLPAVQQAAPVSTNKESHGVVKIVAIIILALVAVTFIGLFVWMFIRYNDTQEDVDYQISLAVAAAKEEQAEADAVRYQNEAKNPLKTFAGPEDYGQLTFLYPKTWSVYVADDASDGSDFEAYFNPNQVNNINDKTVNALRLSIVNERYEDVIDKYQRDLTSNPPTLSLAVITVGSEESGTNTTANRYVGTIPGTDFNGIIVVFKIRDKTVVLRTDSMLFEEDFNALISTITFNG